MQAEPLAGGGVLPGRLAPPPSKSVTNRYLNLAVLGRSPLAVERPLDAADIETFLAALPLLGMAWRREAGGDAPRLLLSPSAPAERAEVDCAASGTMARFLTATLCTVPGVWRLDGSPRLRERPLGPLVEALRRLGGELSELGRPGCLPLEIHGSGLGEGRVELAASQSSQFVSALLMAATRARGEVELEISGLVSAPYVGLTVEAMRRFGGRIERRTDGGYRVRPGLEPPDRVRVEADWSAACYPAAAAALTARPVALAGLDRRSAQADRRFLDLLEEMGCEVRWEADGSLSVGRSAPLRAIDADLGDLPDQAPTLAVLAPFARGTTTLRNVGHLRLKESDRLEAVREGLLACGVPAEIQGEGLRVPGVWAQEEPPRAPVNVDSHDDHRIAMSFAVLALRRPGVRIDRPQVVEKSYPGFWEDLEKWRAS